MRPDWNSGVTALFVIRSSVLFAVIRVLPYPTNKMPRFFPNPPRRRQLDPPSLVNPSTDNNGAELAQGRRKADGNSSNHSIRTAAGHKASHLRVSVV
jgi:hypothetical protein